jgi:hypothetical protein
MDTLPPSRRTIVEMGSDLAWDLGPAGTLSRTAAVDAPLSPGMARLVGWKLSGPSPIALYRLTMRRKGLAGLYNCVAGTFVPVAG